MVKTRKCKYIEKYVKRINTKDTEATDQENDENAIQKEQEEQQKQKRITTTEMRKLKNRKSSGCNKVTPEMTKSINENKNTFLRAQLKSETKVHASKDALLYQYTKKDIVGTMQISVRNHYSESQRTANEKN